MATLKAIIVGKDFGAATAFDLAIQHPDRITGIITVGMPFAPKAFAKIFELPEGFYIKRWGVRDHCMPRLPTVSS